MITFVILLSLTTVYPVVIFVTGLLVILIPVKLLLSVPPKNPAPVTAIVTAFPYSALLPLNVVIVGAVVVTSSFISDTELLPPSVVVIMTSYVPDFTLERTTALFITLSLTQLQPLNTVSADSLIFTLLTTELLPPP